MKRITISEETIKEMFISQENSEDGKYSFVELGDFMSDHKCDIAHMIIKDNETEKFYRTYIQQEGAYWRSFEYYYDELCDEVEAKKVMVTTWQPVKE